MRILRSGHPANLCERTEVQNLLKPEIIWKVMPSEREERDYRPTLFFTILRHLATVLGVKHLSNTSVLSLYDCCRAVSASPEGSRLMIKEPFKAATVSVRNSNFRTTAENHATATSHQDAMYAPQFKPPKNHNCTHSIDAVATPSFHWHHEGLLGFSTELSSGRKSGDNSGNAADILREVEYLDCGGGVESGVNTITMARVLKSDSGVETETHVFKNVLFGNLASNGFSPRPASNMPVLWLFSIAVLVPQTLVWWRMDLDSLISKIRPESLPAGTWH
ncbi:hypothetical protein B0H14DRAFT_2609006 [Mycena olivaceomarginata]|nr:hypothetical protein B0H14DRAFT_2609006 [Mycena olivaceomarginata]